ncbi:protein kinase [Stieleria sp.]|uniref:protein kinase domain-containing protein n=1 Tax=Stieleria sp. TaxID=2795976 RepID=UPI003566A823
MIAARELRHANLLLKALADGDIIGAESGFSEGDGHQDGPPTAMLEVAETSTSGRGLHGLNPKKHSVLGRYELLEEIGHGGMGTVYMARQTEPVRRRVAVKVINPGMDSREVLARFEAERQALAMMDHPNIARVFDGGTTESGWPYFVMELVRGVPLTRFCQENELGLRERLELFIDVCRAVQHAHQKAIIHRDLKPNNILVTMHDDKPVVKVIDFGVAKALDQDLTDKTLFTQFSELIGTPLYMSPEQAQMSSLDVDTRSDVYSLGVILYELLTGTTPFDRDTLSRVGIDGFRRLVQEKEPERPSSRISTLKAANLSTAGHRAPVDIATIRSDLHLELDWVVLKSLEKNRERRYDSAKALADDVQRYLNDEAVEACPPSAGYRFRKWLGRNRLAVTAGTAAVAALVFITTLSLWQVQQVNRAWQASQSRERQVSDLLDASQLRSAVSAFRQGEFPLIADKLGPTTAVPVKANPHRGDDFFRNLLLDLSHPPFDRQLVLDAEISDLALDRSGNHAWILDADGNIYRSEGGRLESDATVAVGSIGAPAEAIAVSPDGTMLAVGVQSQISLWSLSPSVKELRRIVVGDHGVETIVWSDDGSHLAVGTRYEGVWVGNAEGESLFRIENDHRHESLLFRPGSRELLVPTRQGIVAYSVPAGKKTRSITLEPMENPRELMLAGPEKNWLLCCDRFWQQMLILDADSFQEIGRVTLNASYPQSHATWHNGRRLALLFPDGLLQTLRLSQRSGGQVSGELTAAFNIADDHRLFQENQRIRVLASPNGDALITAGPGGRLRQWNLSRVRPTQVLSPPAPLGAVYPVAPDALAYFFRKRHAHPDYDRELVVGIGSRIEQTIGERVTHPITCFSQQISRQGWIACAGPGYVSVYDLSKGRIVRTLGESLAKVHRVEISPSGDAVAVNAGDEPGVMAWYSETGWQSANQVLDLPLDLAAVFCFVDSDDGPSLLYDESSQLIQEFNCATGVRRVVRNEPSTRLMASAVRADGEQLAICTRDKLEVIDIKTGKLAFAIDQVSTVRTLAFLPGGRVLLSGHNNGRIESWHVPTGQALGTLFEPPQGIGLPQGFAVFPGSNRLLIRYQRDEHLSPVILGTELSSR